MGIFSKLASSDFVAGAATKIGDNWEKQKAEQSKTLQELVLRTFTEGKVLRDNQREKNKRTKEQYEDALSEEVEEIKETLTERLDSYLEYVTNEWFEENALAIEQGLKNEMTESFLIGMKDLFEAHYVSIPEEKYDVLNSMVEKLDEMEEKLNEQIEKNIHLNKRLAESVADGIFDEISEGLAATQKEKLASLAESVEFECEEEYREKLETLREAYFPKNVASPSAKRENLSEGVDSSYASVSDSMNAYLNTLSKFSK